MIVRPHSILLDAEALSALARDDRSMQAWATFAKRSDSVLYASCLTLAEVADGTARDVGVRRPAKAVRLVDVSRRSGIARASYGRQWRRLGASIAI